MSQLKNSEIIKHVLQTLINKIGRRTSESFALVIIRYSDQRVRIKI